MSFYHHEGRERQKEGKEDENGQETNKSDDCPTDTNVHMTSPAHSPSMQELFCFNV